jgi:hypothetical protein
MSDRVAAWIRRGLAGRVGRAAVDGAATAPRASASVQAVVRADDGTTATTEPTDVELYGPGDIVALDRAQIRATYPRPGTPDAETNYFCYVELVDGDLPWRYSPAAPDPEGRVPSWLALVVIADDEGAVTTDGAGRRVLTTAGRHLPPPDQVWAWAHAFGDDDDLDAFHARVMCPRKLRADAQWTACLVPAFATGRDAGLGVAVTDSAEPAWTADDEKIILPAYHDWTFSTAANGDFRQLARRLTARELPGTVGRRPLDISSPGAPLPAKPGAAVDLVGALRSPSYQPTPVDDALLAKFATVYRQQLERLPGDAGHDGDYDPLVDDPVVGPPRYGAPQRRGEPLPSDDEHWFAEVNLAPADRAVAALGVEVVKVDQESLMAAAWEYAAALPRINDRLQRARLADETARHRLRKFSSLEFERFQVAGPAVRDIEVAEVRLDDVLRAGGVPEVVGGGALRRLGRRSGPLQRRRRSYVSESSVEPAAPATRLTFTAFTAPDVVIDRSWTAPIGTDFGIRAEVGDIAGTVTHQPVGTSGGPVGIDPTVGAVIVPNRRLALTAPRRSHQVRVAPPPVAALTATTTEAPLELVAGAVDPGLAVRAWVDARVRVTAGGAPLTTTGEVVPAALYATPHFPMPMYERLRALSVEYVLPGVGAIPANTVGALVIEERFVEAFLLGANHELSRELRWREYPAQLHNTWFDQFWATIGGNQPDIAPIGTWKPTRLGTHTLGGERLVVLVKGDLIERYPDLRVSMVEASLVPADDDGEALVRGATADAISISPEIAGELGPGIQFYGFELPGTTGPRTAIEEAQTGGTAGQGWFFAFEEQLRSPRFGLDSGTPGQIGRRPADWSRLGWGHLAIGDDRAEFVDRTTVPELVPTRVEPGDPVWFADAAAMAAITFRRPTRVLIHATAVLEETS